MYTNGDVLHGLVDKIARNRPIVHSNRKPNDATIRSVEDVVELGGNGGGNCGDRRGGGGGSFIGQPCGNRSLTKLAFISS